MVEPDEARLSRRSELEDILEPESLFNQANKISMY